MQQQPLFCSVALQPRPLQLDQGRGDCNTSRLWPAGHGSDGNRPEGDFHGAVQPLTRRSGALIFRRQSARPAASSRPVCCIPLLYTGSMAFSHGAFLFLILFCITSLSGSTRQLKVICNTSDQQRGRGGPAAKASAAAGPRCRGDFLKNFWMDQIYILIDLKQVYIHRLIRGIEVTNLVLHLRCIPFALQKNIGYSLLVL